VDAFYSPSATTTFTPIAPLSPRPSELYATMFEAVPLEDAPTPDPPMTMASPQPAAPPSPARPEPAAPCADVNTGIKRRRYADEGVCAAGRLGHVCHPLALMLTCSCVPLCSPDAVCAAAL
jgi:hypothetical protein